MLRVAAAHRATRAPTQRDRVKPKGIGLPTTPQGERGSPGFWQAVNPRLVFFLDPQGLPVDRASFPLRKSTAASDTARNFQVLPCGFAALRNTLCSFRGCFFRGFEAGAALGMARPLPYPCTAAIEQQCISPTADSSQFFFMVASGLQRGLWLPLRVPAMGHCHVSTMITPSPPPTFPSVHDRRGKYGLLDLPWKLVYPLLGTRPAKPARWTKPCRPVRANGNTADTAHTQ